jgi:hypothetical protein
MRQLILITALLGSAASSDVYAAPNEVAVHQDEDGYTLRVDGQDTFLFGMNWGYVPVGENYSYDFWSQPEDLIDGVLRTEMGLLQDMGINAIRQYPGIPPRWVEWIYDNYGIYTMINPLVGRYGTTLNGQFMPSTPYGDPAVRAHLIRETLDVVDTYRDVPGVLMFLLGNEANYGLSWTSFEIQALPKGERDAAKARHLYSLYGEIIDGIHAADPHHPVAICNGDLQYIDLIAELAPNMDIMASNVYRGISSRDLFDRVADELEVPFVYSEFGSDAYNAAAGREDHLMQAKYLHGQWQEIYEHSYGKGRANNAIGGFIFQWSDGWWKYLQEENLEVHDTNASWPNRAYPDDYVEDGNNMNEEWFGISAKTPPDPSGRYEVQPRTAYWMLREAFELDPYADTTDIATIEAHFDAIRPTDFTFRYEAAKATTQMREQRARVRNLRVEMSTTTSGGSQREGRGPQNTTFDHGESFYVDVEAKPIEDFRTSMSVNVLGNVEDNRIDDIFFENRANRTDPDPVFEGVNLEGLERVKAYHADFVWNHNAFDFEGFYRTGHYHWGYEGDFFGLYPEANYGPNVDMYNADVPIGVLFTGKRGPLDGLKVAFGPQLYWGANPSIIAKYQRQKGALSWSLMHQEDIAPLPLNQNVTSVVIAEQMTRKSTLHLGYARNEDLKFDIGGIWAGTNKIGQAFTRTQDAVGPRSYAGSGFDVIDDEIRMVDTFGAKVRVSSRKGAFGWYGQGAAKGLVADGGPDAVTTLTGWSLKESGRGNQVSALAGAVLQLGSLQIAPNALYQRPLVGPDPLIDDSYDPGSRRYLPTVRPRNVRDDPFAVIDNRETIAGELMLVFDPTPGSWFFMWNNDVREDAPFAGSLDFVYRHQPTERDANFGYTEDGILFAFDGSPPARDVWDLNSRLVFGLPLDSTLIVLAYVGESQSNGTDPRPVFRKGANARLWMRSVLWDSWVKVDDWGPYDYHRDYNLTFPLQITSDLSVGLGRPKLVGPSTRIGGLFKLRYLDTFSPDVILSADAPWEHEFEVQTYVKVSL